MSEELSEQTRRAILKSAAAALGVGAAGTAAGHPGSAGKDRSNIDGDPGDRTGLDEGEPFRNAESVGYHSLGDVGSAGLAGQGARRRNGDRNAEVRTHGDIAVTSFRGASGEDGGRRIAVLDISEFNDASTLDELESAELTVLSFLRNRGGGGGGATDIKLSGDGNYAFIGSQLPTGSSGEFNESDPRGNAEATGGVVVVDISNPDRPRTVDRVEETFSTGVHNLFHHRIDGVDYVFACKDLGFVAPDSGVYVLRFDRDPGKLTVVNRWTADGNTVRGEVGTQHGLSYVHDIEVHDDPRTGRPTAYVADWDRGVRVLDVSDPTDIEHVGQFDMFQCHFAAPFPALVEDGNGNERRVAVASHEELDERFDQRDSTLFNTPHRDKTNPNSTGTVFLVDCDGVYPEDAEEDHIPDGQARSAGDGPKQLGELDNWTWTNVDTGKGFDGRPASEISEEERRERFEAIRQPEGSYKLSPHNSQPAVHEIDGEERYVVHQGHYHGGVRYIEVRPGTETGLTEIDGGTPGEEGRRRYRPRANPNVDDRGEDERIGWINNSTDWDLVDIGHARPDVETVKEEYNDLSPDFWSSVEHNGVSFHGDRNAGVHVTYYTGPDGEGDGPARDAFPLEAPRPPVEVDRDVGSSVYLGETVGRVTIDVTAFERGNSDAADVRVRDRLPESYEVVGGNETTTYPQGVRQAVEFEDVTPPNEGGSQRAVEPGESRELTYFFETDGDVDSATFGPVEISGDGGDTWVTVGGTTDSSFNTGFGV